MVLTTTHKSRYLAFWHPYVFFRHHLISLKTFLELTYVVFCQHPLIFSSPRLNVGTRQGRNLHFLQMVILPLVPIAGLIIQNCISMEAVIRYQEDISRVNDGVRLQPIGGKKYGANREKVWKKIKERISSMPAIRVRKIVWDGIMEMIIEMEKNGKQQRS